MALNVAINGFGRIGRLAFRLLHGSPDATVVAVNDLTQPAMLAHLLRYDSAHGRYDKQVTHSDGGMVVDGETIRVYAEKDPAKLPWDALKVDAVLECSGRFTSKQAAMAHIHAGAGKVVISAVAGSDMPTIVYGVNEHILQTTDRIVSAASCTTNCLAPMVYALHKLVPIQKGFMTTVHAYTNDQNTLDAPHPKGDLRRARAAAHNIIPQSTGAARAIGLVLPALAGKLDGSAQRVPVLTGSIVELVAVVAGKVSAQQVNDAMKTAASATPVMSEVFGYTEEEIVSSDVIGMRYATLFDATQTKVTALNDEHNTLVKVAAWYDNEHSYTCQMIRTMNYLCAGLAT